MIGHLAWTSAIISGRVSSYPMTQSETARLAKAMEWVIPTDSSPGAGTPACVQRLVDLISSQPSQVAELYRAHLPTLLEADLSDRSNAFAQLFVEHVRDVYYGYPDTGAWADIGFKVSDP